MPTQYTVQQGDYLSLIADQNGFHTYQTIWDDPANADLKQKRQNPNVLLPGDLLTIPDKGDKSVSCATNSKHKFVVKGEQLKLRLIVKDESGNPVKNAPATLILDGASTSVTTDGSGKIEQTIPRSTREGQLIVKTTNPPVDLNLHIGVGEIDPLDTITGQIGRLNNLGYDAGPAQAPADGDDAAMNQFRSAVEEFQCNAKINVDGKCGPQTQAALKKAFGC